MSNNHVNIEIIDSIPIISMEYSNLDSFQDLVFLLFSQAGSNLLSSTLEKELLLNNKLEELKILKIIAQFINEDDIYDEDSDQFLNPSSFK